MSLSENILAADRKIRCVTVIDERGNIKSNKCAPGVEVLLGPIELKAFALGVAVRRAMRERWSQELGKARWLFLTRDKIGVAVFYDAPGGETIIVTTQPDFDVASINKIKNAIEASVQ